MTAGSTHALRRAHASAANPRSSRTASVFVSASLEAVLGIGRNASDKPRRIGEAIAGLDLNDMASELQPLLDAVRRRG